MLYANGHSFGKQLSSFQKQESAYDGASLCGSLTQMEIPTRTHPYLGGAGLSHRVTMAPRTTQKPHLNIWVHVLKSATTLLCRGLDAACSSALWLIFWPALQRLSPQYRNFWARTMESTWWLRLVSTSTLPAAPGVCSKRLYWQWWHLHTRQLSHLLAWAFQSYLAGSISCLLVMSWF
jgi:hypothetical protein